jgi:hypothetical protein
MGCPLSITSSPILSNISSRWNKLRSEAFSASAAAGHRNIGGAVQIVTALVAVIAVAAVLYFYPRLAGYALYHGYLPVKGRIAGHESNLPSKALRCANCHEPVQGAASAIRIRPPLTGAALTQPHSRRGGPATAYTESSFCAILHEGIDPAYVMVNRTMPRYDVSASSCHALWSYVSSR